MHPRIQTTNALKFQGYKSIYEGNLNLSKIRREP